MEFATLLSKALTRQDEASSITGSGVQSIHVSFTTAPSGMMVDDNGQLIEMPDARATWARSLGMTDDEPPPPRPAARPTLIYPLAAANKPPRTTANEITFGGGDDDDDADETL